MKLYNKMFLGFLGSMTVTVLTAWWWFGAGMNPKPMPFGHFFVLNMLHALISAITLALGLGGVIEYLIQREKR